MTISKLSLVAVCRKLVIIFYNIPVHGSKYVEFGQEKYLQQIEEREKRLVIKLAKKHNWEVKYS